MANVFTSGSNVEVTISIPGMSTYGSKHCIVSSSHWLYEHSNLIVWALKCEPVEWHSTCKISSWSSSLMVCCCLGKIRTWRSMISERCSIGFKSGEMAGQDIMALMLTMTRTFLVWMALWTISFNPIWLPNHVTHHLFVNSLVSLRPGEHVCEVSPQSVKPFWRRRFLKVYSSKNS